MLNNIFPVPLLISQLDYNCGGLSDEEGIKNINTTNTEYVPESRFRILEKYPGIRLALTIKFNQLFLEAFGTKCDHIITTSWVTYQDPGDKPAKHHHKNCTWAGVWYFDEYDKTSGNIVFDNPLWDTLYANMYSLGHIMSIAKPYGFTPTHNSLIFFPAQLHHQVQPVGKIRKSLAFNLMEDFSKAPVTNDSTFKPEWLVDND